MSAYEGFASVYDHLMEDVEYDAWVAYLQEIWQKENSSPKLLAELGCGTGSMTQRLIVKGYDVIGIDISEDMLTQARRKAEEAGLSVLYLHQDMREFSLYGTVDCIYSLCDSLNYILEEAELLTVFRLVNNYLNPGGLFIFDMNTEYKFREVLGNHTFTDVQPEAAYIWENYYDLDEGINEFYVNFFIREPDGGSYRRLEEVHYEKAYSLTVVEKLLAQSGLELVAFYDALTFLPPKPDSERIYCVAKEVQKNKKGVL